MSDFAGLSIEGRLATPSDSDWDAARAAWNLAVDQQPRAVAFVEGAADVAQVIRHAAEHGLSVTAQGTGHGAASLGALEDTILVKTERMRGIEVDAQARTARVEAGVLAAELGAGTQEHGLCSLPGSSPDVGVIGYTLGGGLGWLGRAYGFACNAVSAIELVTAAGESRRVDAEHDADLFWALRGGGGGYALVTALQIELLPVAELYAGALILPAELGADAVRAYRDWAESGPEQVTSTVRFLRPPPMPDVPEPLRDRPLLTIGAACIGSREEGEALIAPLRELGGSATIMDTFAQIPAEGLARINMDPEHPVPALSHHGVLRELPDEAIDAFVAAAGPDAGSPLLLAELRHAGGALARVPENAGALAKLDAAYVMLGIGAPITPELGARVNGHLDHLDEQLRPWSSEGGYFNFAERPCDVDAILPAETCARLRDVKRRWDPDDVVRANHALSVA
jgi:FAD/FMN-containing dehydrogenase